MIADMSINPGPRMTNIFTDIDLDMANKYIVSFLFISYQPVGLAIYPYI